MALRPKSPIPPTPQSPARPLHHPTAIILLLASGIALFALSGDFGLTHQNASKPLRAFIWYPILAAAILLSLIPRLHRPFSRALDKIRHPASRPKLLIFALITIIATWYFQFTALNHGATFLPHFHDEFMYLIQARMLAAGHLWMPRHPLADFFETFHVLVTPVYAPIYFPGAALMYTPAICLGIQPEMLSLLICGFIVGMMYLVFARSIDGVYGLLAALLTISLGDLQFLATMVMSHSVLLLLGLLMIWMWQNWRDHKSAAWAAGLGAMMGWAAITRPIDALCFAIPIGLAFLLDLRSCSSRRWFSNIAVLIAATIPFLALQMRFDYGVTGSLFKTPVTLYGNTNWPGAGYGLAPLDANFRPPSRLPQIQDYYHYFLKPGLLSYQPGKRLDDWIHRRIPTLLRATLPWAILLILAPASLLNMRRRRWVIPAALPVFLIGYTFYPNFLEHYAVMIAPAMIALILLGAGAVQAGFPKFASLLATLLPFSIAAVAIASLPELNPDVMEPRFEAHLLADVDLKLANLEHKPAVVLFRYRPVYGGSFHEEPVYNADVAWPDDAPIIRAHDLGPQNYRIFQYYAAREPRRFFYLYDESTSPPTLRPLGWDKDLASAVKP